MFVSKKFKIISSVVVLTILVLSFQNCGQVPLTSLNTTTPSGDGKASLHAYVTLWDTTLTSAQSSASNQIKLPLLQSGTYNFVVNWGDDTQSEVTSWNDPDALHTYETAGIYTITLTGSFSEFAFSTSTAYASSPLKGDRLKLLDVQQWGSNQWASMAYMFHGCSNVIITAVDAPDLSNVTVMNNMFNGAVSFNQDISHWDTSNITSMGYMFVNATSFNQNIASWDTSKVYNMNYMFYKATNFNQNLSGWNVDLVTNSINFAVDATAWTLPKPTF